MFNNLLTVNCLVSKFFISLYAKIDKTSDVKFSFVLYIYALTPACKFLYYASVPRFKEFTVSTPLHLFIQR
jgi:hypothetical protein